MNNEGGTLGADPGSGGVTITFAVAPNFATLVSPNYIPLVLDAGQATMEIVYLTAYTAGATTGTIARAQEDATHWPAVAHPSGTWVCAPTVADFNYPSNGYGVSGNTGATPTPAVGLTTQKIAISTTSLTATWAQCATLSLAAGTWLLMAPCEFDNTGNATGLILCSALIGPTSSSSSGFYTSLDLSLPIAATQFNSSFTMITTIVLASPASIYLNAQASTIVGTPQINGNSSLVAVRIA